MPSGLSKHLLGMHGLGLYCKGESRSMWLDLKSVSRERLEVRQSGKAEASQCMEGLACHDEDWKVHTVGSGARSG